MLLVKTIKIFAFVILYGQRISSATDDNRYCYLESRCDVDDTITSPLHIGCPKSFANSPSLYKLIKLKYHDREFIANEFNQFRSDIAMGVHSQILKYPLKPMTQLEWSHELEYLVSLMISKVPNTNFYCMATETSNRPSQLYVLIDRPRSFNLRNIFTLAINEIKTNALRSFRDANIGDTVNWSQIYDKDASALGCAFGEFNSINVNDKLLIRCSFYGSKYVKINFTTEYISTTCPAKRRNSDSFPGLCVKDELVLMTGDKGDIGWRGELGINGRNGERGSAGIQGSPGQNGVVGMNGDQGDEGQTGNVGQINNAGEVGDEGEKGECVKGPSGSRGPPGYDGQPGKVGVKGDKGKKGVQGESISLAELKGEIGEAVTGPKGMRGRWGDRGFKGQKGEEGSKGSKGEEGTVKYDGDEQLTCPLSEKGDQGPPGPPGSTGSPGTAELLQTEFEIEVATKKSTDMYD